MKKDFVLHKLAKTLKPQYFIGSRFVGRKFSDRNSLAILWYPTGSRAFLCTDRAFPVPPLNTESDLDLGSLNERSSYWAPVVYLKPSVTLGHYYFTGGCCHGQQSMSFKSPVNVRRIGKRIQSKGIKVTLKFLPLDVSKLQIAVNQGLFSYPTQFQCINAMVASIGQSCFSLPRKIKNM